ncbi:MAG: hypothetical protein ABIE84_03095 [bacterium]
MPKLTELFQQNKLTLIVELPKIDWELAEAAIGAGADALQITMTKDRLANLAEVKKDTCRIVDCVKHPVGLSFANNVELSEKELEFIGSLHFDFLNLGVEHLSPEIVNLKMGKIISVNCRFSLEEIVDLSSSNIGAIDAAIIPSSDKGKSLTVGDLQNYISIIVAAGLPVIIPTQRLIRPSEVAIIADTEAKALLLTSTVTGTTPKHLAQSVSEFRLAIDELSL